MAYVFQVLLNYPRTELLKDSWALSRLASAVKPGVLLPTVGVVKPGKLSDDMWREPNTGVFMLAPLPMTPQYFESNLSDLWQLALSSWRYANGFLERIKNGDGTQINAMSPKRASANAQAVEISVALALIAKAAEFNGRLRWVLETKDPLKPNEGWSVWVYPPGSYTDRAIDYMLIAFGGRYILHIKMNGTASLHVNQGTSADPAWIEAVEFKYSGGGVDHGKPFQITVIPWGFDYISFMFSQNSSPKEKSKTANKSSKTNTFLYSVNEYEGRWPEYDSVTTQWVKTLQAPLSVAIRTVNFQYEFAFARVRYPEDSFLLVTPDILPEVKPHATPEALVRGFTANEGDSSSSSGMQPAILDSDGTDWNPETDQEVTLRVIFTSSENQVYTPELWSYDLDLPPLTHTPEWTELDVSEYVQYLRFERGVDPDVSVADVKLEIPPEYANILRPSGPLRILASGEPIFDGYVVDKHPTLEGPLALLSVQMECRDMWVRLNEKRVSDYKFLDGLKLLDLIKAMIRKSGWLEEDIEVDDPDEILANLEIGNFFDPNDQKAINGDSSIGDALREILKTYASRPIRVRFVGDKWKIYMAPSYDQGTPPTKKFFLKSELITVPAAPPPVDEDRFENSQYYILSNPEFTSGKVNFNGLEATGVTTTGGGSEKVQSLIPWAYADPDSVNDPDNFWFVGRPIPKRLAPPEFVTPQTQDELDILARTHWDRYRHERPLLEFLGEWQPEIDCDDFIWVIGVNPSGERVSYGAYRIDNISVELDMDRQKIENPDYEPEEPGSQEFIWPDGDGRWAMMANYTCVYVGPAEDEDTLMFTTMLPEDVA